MFLFVLYWKSGFKLCCQKLDGTDEENTVNTDIKKDFRELGKMR